MRFHKLYSGVTCNRGHGGLMKTHHAPQARVLSPQWTIQSFWGLQMSAIGALADTSSRTSPHKHSVYCPEGLSSHFGAFILMGWVDSYLGRES